MPLTSEQRREVIRRWERGENVELTLEGVDMTTEMLPRPTCGPAEDPLHLNIMEKNMTEVHEHQDNLEDEQESLEVEVIISYYKGRVTEQDERLALLLASNSAKQKKINELQARVKNLNLRLEQFNDEDVKEDGAADAV